MLGSVLSFGVSTGRANMGSYLGAQKSQNSELET